MLCLSSIYLSIEKCWIEFTGISSINQYIFNILYLKLPTNGIHQCRNSLKRFFKRDPNGEGFITYGHGAWFEITALYETTTHTNFYQDTISIAFNKFIAALRDYEYSSCIPETLDERSCLMFLNSLINPVANLRRHIKSCEKV